MRRCSRRISAVLGALVVALVAACCAWIPHNRSHEERRTSLSPRRAAWVSGLFAAAVLATSPTFWFAATRAVPEMLGVALLLLACLLWLGSLDLAHRRWIYPASLLTGVGCVENATFFILLPVFLIILLAHSLRRRRRIEWRRVGACAGLFLLGYSLVFYAASVVHRSESAAWRGFDGYWESLLAVFRQQKVMLALSIPRVGWILLGITSVLPLAMTLMPKERMQRQTRWPSYLLHGLLTVLAGLLLTNLFLSVYSLLHLAPLVVAPVVVNAVWIGYLAGYWWCVFHSGSHFESTAGRHGKRVAAMLWPGFLVAAAVAMGWNGQRLIHPRHTEWTDACADHLLRQLPDDAVFMTETPLDDVLLLKAAAQGRRLHLVSPSRASSAAYVGYLGTVWKEPRLRSLVPVGPMQVVAEWMRIDPAAAAARFRTDFYDGPLFSSGEAPLAQAPFYLPAGGRKPDPETAARALEDWAALPYMTAAFNTNAPPHFTFFSNWLRSSAAKLANNLGVEAEAADRPDLAERHYRLARRWNPDNASALLNLAELARTRRLPDQAGVQRDLDAFIESTLSRNRLSLLHLNQLHGLIARPEAHMQRGLAWAVSGKPALAAGEIRRAMELTEQSDQLRAFLAFAQFEGGQTAEAEATVQEMLAKDPAHATALAQLARLQASRGDLVSARATMARAVEAGKGIAALRLQQAGLEMLAGDNASALSLARALTRDVPHHVEAWALVAHLAHLAGDRALVAEAEETLKASPSLPPAVYVVLSDLRMREGNLSAAREILERALRHNAGNTALMEQLLRVAYQHRDRRLARQVVTDLLRQDPSHAYGNLVLGSLHYHDNEMSFAEASFRASLAAKRTPEALNSLAFVLFELGRCAEALPLADEADALQPGDANILDSRAMIRFCLGRSDEALPLSRRAVELDQGNPALLLNLARILDVTGEKAEALRICDTLFASVGTLPPPMQTPLTDLRARLTAELRSPDAARRGPES